MTVAEKKSGWLWPAGLGLAWILFSVSAFGADQTLSGALRSLTLRSEMVVTGRVASIDRQGDVVTVTLAVEETLKGTSSASYTFREWAGLWPMGQSRYELGQRATFFLHAASKSGLASTVDGSDGVVPIAQQAADQPVMLDMRRLAARLERSVGAPMIGDEESAITLADARVLIVHAGDPTQPIQPEPILRPLPIGVVRPLQVKVLLEQRVVPVEELSR